MKCNHLYMGLASLFLLFVGKGSFANPIANDPDVLYKQIRKHCEQNGELTRKYTEMLFQYGKRNSDKEIQVHALIFRGNCACRRLDLAEGIIQLQRTDSLLINWKKDLGDSYSWLYRQWLKSIGLYYTNSGDYEGAILAHQQMFDFLDERRLQDTLSKYEYNDLQSTYIRLGIVYKRMGAYDKALQYFNYLIRLKGSDKEGMAYKHMGDVYVLKENWPLAKKSYQRALAIHTLAFKVDSSMRKNRDRLTTTLLAIAGYYEAFGKDSLAIGLPYLHQVARLNEGATNDLQEYIYSLNGRYYHQLRRLDTALHFYDQLLVYCSEKFGANSPKVAKALRVQGEVYASQNNLPKALSLYNQSLHTLTAQGTELPPRKAIFFVPQDLSTKRELLHTLTAKAALQHAYFSDSIQSAWHSAQWAIHLLDSLKWDYQLGEDKLNLAKKGYETYEVGLQILFSAWSQNQSLIPNLESEIFALFEKSKSLLLTESLLEGEAVQHTMIPPQLLERERALQLSIYQLIQLLETPKNPAHKLALQDQLYQTQEKHGALLDSIKGFSKLYAILKEEQVGANRLSVMQSKLASDQIAVEYFWGQNVLWGLAISKQEVFFFKSDQLEGIKEKLALLALQVAHPPSFNRVTGINGQKAYSQFVDAGTFLYHELLQKPIQAFQPQKLILVPDGQLSNLPFGVLLQTPPKTPHVSYSPHHLPYVIRDYPLSYAYSLEVWLSQSNMRKTKKEPEELSLLGFAPTYPQNNLSGLYSNRSSLSPATKWKDLYELIHAKRELNKIVALFDSNMTLALVDSLATRSRFQTLAPRASILHLAMHSYVNERHPMYSGLFFHPTDSATKQGDEVLYAYEIMNMELQAELAVLSMCNGETGIYRPGQGPMSLSKAFSMAKCPSLVSSLWAVNDLSTSQLMELFYQELTTGISKDEALQNAKLAYLALGHDDAANYHPYYWASFIHIGNQEPLTQFQSPNDRWIWIIGGLLGFSTLIFLFVLKRRNSKRV